MTKKLTQSYIMGYGRRSRSAAEAHKRHPDKIIFFAFQSD